MVSLKISAIDFSIAGDKYLGRSYDEMDCQKFIERCLQDVGIRLDLKGSNAWYRKCMDEGWTGSPEECVRVFGSVPKGAFLFIHSFDGGEERRGYHDGFGNASHIGIVTGRGKGAVHSSQSRGMVAESEFHNRTVSNGGWNMVGLWNQLDYGTTVGWALDHIGIGQNPVEETKEANIMNVIIQAENGGPVKLRQGNDPKRSGYSVWEEYPSGTKAVVLQSGDEWSRIRIGNRTGWMMSRFLAADDGDVPAESEDCGAESGDEAQVLLSEIYRILRDLCEKIEQKAGVG